MHSPSQVFAPEVTQWKPMESTGGDWETDHGTYDPGVYWEIEFADLSAYLDLWDATLVGFSAGEPYTGIMQTYIPEIGKVTPNNIPPHLHLYGAMFVTDIPGATDPEILQTFLNRVTLNLRTDNHGEEIGFIMEFGSGSGRRMEGSGRLSSIPGELLVLSISSIGLDGNVPRTIRVYPTVVPKPAPAEPGFVGEWTVRLRDITDDIVLFLPNEANEFKGFASKFLSLAGYEPDDTTPVYSTHTIYNRELSDVVGQGNLLTRAVQGDFELYAVAAYFNPLPGRGEFYVEMAGRGLPGTRYWFRVKEFTNSYYNHTSDAALGYAYSRSITYDLYNPEDHAFIKDIWDNEGTITVVISERP